MKNLVLTLLIDLSTTLLLQAQVTTPKDKQKNTIYSLIANYSKARESGDTMLLKCILTKDVDQLVSTGEWRSGIDAGFRRYSSKIVTRIESQLQSCITFILSLILLLRSFHD